MNIMEKPNKEIGKIQSDLIMGHTFHVLEETVNDDCDICQNPQKYVAQTQMHTCPCGDEHILVVD